MVSFGTDEIISRIVGQYSSMLLHLAASRLDSPADAEDAVQEVFLKLLTARPVVRGAEHENAWLSRATLDRASDIRRGAERRNLPLEEAPETAVFDTPAQSELFREVMALPPKYRAAVYLHYYEGYSVREVACAMNANPSTVQTWLMRARGQLKTNLKEAESP